MAFVVVVVSYSQCTRRSFFSVVLYLGLFYLHMETEGPNRSSLFYLTSRSGELPESDVLHVDLYLKLPRYFSSQIFKLFYD